MVTHQDNHLKRFNLDIIMSYGLKQRTFNGQIRCLCFPSLKFDMDLLLDDTHECVDKDCGNLERRIIRRTKDFKHENEEVRAVYWDCDRKVMLNDELKALLRLLSIKITKATDKLIGQGCRI